MFFGIQVKFVKDFFKNIFYKQVRKKAIDNTNLTANLFVLLLKQSVDVPYPPASTPGQPPRRRTGVGQRAIRSTGVERGMSKQDIQNVVYFDSTGFYMEILDRGSNPRIAPRPFIYETYQLHEQALLSMLTRG